MRGSPSLEFSKSGMEDMTDLLNAGLVIGIRDHGLIWPVWNKLIQ